MIAWNSRVLMILQRSSSVVVKRLEQAVASQVSSAYSSERTMGKINLSTDVPIL